MSIQQNFPAISPSLNLNFARSKTLDPRITFTRTSSATRVNGQGLIEVIPANSARFDHSYDPVSGTVRSLGLLVEEARTNLVTYSEDFTQSIWDAPFTGRSRATRVTSTGVDDPSGGNTAATFANGGSLADELIWRAFTATANIPYTMSVWIRRRSGIGDIGMVVGDNIGIDITSQVTSDWKRISLTSTPTTTTVRAYIQIFGINDQIDIWGYQLEAGAFPTSYIPTLGSTVTRTADNASMRGENFSSWYNQSEGTVFTAFRCDNWNSSNQFGKVFTINQAIFGVENNGFWIGNDADNSNTVRYRVRSGGVNQFGPANLTRTSTIVKSAIAVKSSDFAITIDGNIPTTSTSGTLPQVMNSLTIGRDIIGVEDKFLNGHISQLTYYPKRLPNAFLQNLTK
jgi:hypothetical protein